MRDGLVLVLSGQFVIQFAWSVNSIEYKTTENVITLANLNLGPTWMIYFQLITKK